MPNPYYTHSGYPASRAQGSSAALRAELAAIMLGFDRLPPLAGAGGRIVGINAAGTAMETVTLADLLDKLEALPGGANFSALAVAGNGVWHAGNFNPASKLDAGATAAAAARLATPRTINGVPFDGTQNINITAGAGTFLPLAGGSMAGMLTAQATTGAMTRDTGGFGKLEVIGGGGAGDAAFMTFHRPGVHAVYFGLDTDNKLKVGGWSAGAVAHELWHAGNLNPGAYAQLSGATFSGLVNVNGGIQSGGAGFSLGAWIGDQINGAPWYGIGRMNADVFGSGGTQVHVAGFYGMRLRTQGAILDIRMGQFNINAPLFSDSLLETSNWLRAGQVYAVNGWLRNTSSGTGIFNEATLTHFYSEEAGAYTLAGQSGTSGPGMLRFRAGAGGATRGLVYWDGSGFGLLNDQGGWSVRCNQGSGYGGVLSGHWSASSSLTTPTVFADHVTATRDGAGNDPYGPIAVTRGTAASYAYFGLTRAGQLGMALGIDTSNRFVVGQASGGPAGTMTSIAMSLSMGGYLTLGDAVAAQRVIAGFDSGQAGSVNASNWFRSIGNSGWYSQDHGGGIWMADSSWVRTYGGKGFLIASGFSAYGMLQLVGQGSGGQEVSINFRDGNQTVDQGWTMGRYANMFFFYREGVIRASILNDGRLASSGRVFGNSGDVAAPNGNGLGRITVSTSGPSGGSQGDIWCVY